jgi:hypothetical protein
MVSFAIFVLGTIRSGTKASKLLLRFGTPGTALAALPLLLAFMPKPIKIIA